MSVKNVATAVNVDGWSIERPVWAEPFERVSVAMHRVAYRPAKVRDAT